MSIEIMARTRRSTKDETPATKGGRIAVGALTGVSVAVVTFIVVVAVVVVILVVVVVVVVVLVMGLVLVVVSTIGLVVCLALVQGQGLSLLPTFFTHFFFLGEYVHTLWVIIL